LYQGGSTIPKKKETAMVGRGFSCSNPSCGKIFLSPLKATNLGSENAGPYYACPYCLTEVAVGENVLNVVVDQNPEAVCTESAKEKRQGVNEKSAASPVKSICGHHLGYLCQRSGGQEIPEECMVCECLLECMRRKPSG
jgi:hypothetical protein